MATSSSTFKLLYFASASSFTHRESEDLPAPMELKNLYPLLESRYPGMTEKILQSCALTVNLEYVDLEDEAAGSAPPVTIQPGDEVAIIPPVSSG